MTKPVIVTRAGKGAALTFVEGDANFTNLQNATVTVKAGTGGTDVVSDLNGTLTLVAGTNVTLTGDNTAKTVTINASGGSSGLSNIVEDTTPQLGGNLDVNGQSIVSTSNGDIVINPNGTGQIVLDGLDWPALPAGASGFSGTVTSVNGTNERISITNAINISLGDTISFTGADAIDAGITTGVTYYVITANDIDGYIQISDTSGGSAKDLTTLSSPGDFNWATGGGAGSFSGGEMLIYSSASSALVWQKLNLNDLNDVNTSGATNGQVLSYNGTNWQATTPSGSSGLSNVVEDTTPQLGGSLDVNGNSITNSQGAGNITLQVGSGSSPASLIVGTGTNIPYIASNGSNGIYVGTNSGTAPGAYLEITPGANSNASLVSYGTGNILLGHLGTGSTGKVIVGKLNTDGTISTNGTGDLILNTNSGTNSGSIVIADGANQNISITPNGSGKIVLDGASWPNADGTNGQVLSTNGSGTLSWTTAGGGGNNIIVLTSSEVNGRFVFPNSNDTVSNSTWTLENAGGISGVSVSSKTFTLPAGTYFLKAAGAIRTSYNLPLNRCNWKLHNVTDGTTTQNWENFGAINYAGSNTYFWWDVNSRFVIAGSKTFEFRTSSTPVISTGSTVSLVMGNESPGEKFTFLIYKIA